MANVIGFYGKKGSGKDWICQRLTARDDRISRFALADSLKDMCSQAFGISPLYFHDPKLKEKLFHTPVNCGEFHAQLQDVTGLIIPIELVAGRIFQTPRELLQQVGTDVVRAVDDNYWLRLARRNLEGRSGLTIVTDVRFPNEYSMLKAMGGFMIHVIRPSQGNSEDSHISENALDTMDADAAVFNMEDDVEPVREFVSDIVDFGRPLRDIYI